MKKIICILVLLLATQMSFGQQNVDELFQKFGKQKNVTRLKLGGFMLGLASLFTETMGVKSVEVLAFEACGHELKNELDETFKNLKNPSFETMISTHEGNERTKVLVKIKDDSIKELVVLSSGDDHALIRIKGNIKPSDIERSHKRT